jgi:hypothetical protein
MMMKNPTKWNLKSLLKIQGKKKFLLNPYSYGQYNLHLKFILYDLLKKIETLM